MRRAASVILAACAALLLLTWHHGDSWFWIWQEAPLSIGAAQIGYRFAISHMDDLDSVLKVAGLVLLAAALLSWPRPRA